MTLIIFRNIKNQVAIIIKSSCLNIGIEDPITFYQEEVIKLNQELNVIKNANKTRQISDDSPEKLIGYFPIKTSTISFL